MPSEEFREQLKAMKDAEEGKVNLLDTYKPDEELLQGLSEEPQQAQRPEKPEKEPKAKAKAKANSKKQQAESTEGGSSKMGQLFQAGALASGAQVLTDSPGKDSQKQKDLDDMLAQMCGEIDADAGKSSQATKSNPKRKAASGKAAAKKKKQTAVKAEEPAVVKMEEDATGVKRELAEEMAPAVKAELAEGASQAVKTENSPKRIKTEVASQDATQTGDAAGMAQMQAWFQGGNAGEGVTPMEAEKQANAAAAAGKPGLLLEQDGGLWYFFTDSFEDDRASPPRLYLFGKARTVVSARQPGQYESCCLVVEGIERCVYLLLNVEDVTDDNEVQQVAEKAKVEFANMCKEHCPGVKILRSKLKYRNYAFEKPTKYGNGELPFLKVVLDSSGKMPLVGMFGETYTHLFGAQTSMTEQFMTRHRVMGPSWLRLRPGSWKEANARLSYCKTELLVHPQSFVTPKTDDQRRELTAAGMPSSSPPLRLMTINMQTLQRSVQLPHEPIAIACAFHPKFNADAPADGERDLKEGMRTWAGVRRMDSRPLPRDSERVLKQKGFDICSSEVSLLSALLAKIQEFDPDVITGFNAYGFDLDVLASRMHGLKLQGWQTFGRLRRPGARVPRVEGGRGGGGYWVGSLLSVGRLVCDVALQARDMLPKVGSYDLPNLAKHQLQLTNVKILEPEELPSHYETAEGLKHLVELTVHSCCAVSRLAHSLQILPLTKQLTNLAGNGWNASLQNKRAERNEMLLCHEFFKNKFVLPDKESVAEKKKRGGPVIPVNFDDPDEEQATTAGPKRGKAAYSGGLVLEPKVGLYDDYVMMLDFNSLYPSIIQEHNICFTTVERPNELQVEKCETEAELLAQTRQPDGTLEQGILPQVLRRLVDSRRNVKSAMKSEKDPRRRQMLDIRQLALKLTANSMYGCLGFRNSRFYAKPLAALITARGRDALQTTITVVQQELLLDVVYGDTDSVFVNTKTQDYAAAMRAAQQIKTSVNKRYKRLEIEIDAVFGRLMLLKKKKYAALKVVDMASKQFEEEFKGLDIVRRDWCPLAKDIGYDILRKILYGEGKEEAVNWIHSFLTQCGQDMDEDKVPLEKYVITKGLTKDPKDYPDAKNQPHVQVALRLLARGKAVRPGQEVAYVVCEASSLKLEEGSKGHLAERARHPHELEMDKTLKIDFEWYKKQQVHPLVSRLLAPVEQTDAARLAECLKLDASRFAQAAGAHGRDDENQVLAANADVSALFDRSVRFRDFSSRLPGVTCQGCKAANTWKQMLRPEQSEAVGADSLFRCGGCKQAINPRLVQNLLVIQFRGLLKEHSEGWVECPGHDVAEKTRRLTSGQNMVGSRVVLNEMEFMEFLCDEREELLGADPRNCLEALAGMRRTTQWLLETNGFNWVDCGAIFSSIFGKKQQ
mmetsp:Transcript_81862/g.171237  ORF Transcript_81862/g.171237 Transcript_81862/m.171237 type:complete len:1403 (+) Transcript_81862:356-4564(+)|eukprot:CAMPEP_0206489668 /NCGR_PEP_ID=MMETSP0324_2-20121206/43449_1 /ASSEMBLY_ACC=CAM_ASM_000836 /TAXON_ID=2866 /ORGANISM="Crypthecodinium cohnii, Strain Seligo" /LENGTH=1402 /DNA_ID=CAMNT_0053969535 /DNA_START=299 /DNA_END=4507 /DNA_ORIENTATION=-